MDKIKKTCAFLVSLPNTIRFNFSALPFKKAIKFPFWVDGNVKFRLKGEVLLQDSINKPFTIRIGVNGSEHIVPNKYTFFSLGKEGKVIFNGKVDIAIGSAIRVDEGTLNFGDNFSCNRNCNISCSDGITFGRNVLIGWNVWIRDTDGHRIFLNQEEKEAKKKVIIGNHVWICSFTDILKGVEIKDDSVVAWRACVVKPINESNALIGGFPAKVIQSGIHWEK